MADQSDIREANIPARVDCVVIGAGVIGLAVARELAVSGHDVAILEREDGIGSQISARNSEVIHAGLYYAPGSLKAAACIEGRRDLYAYCEQRHIAHRRCGKLVVAADEAGVAALSRIAENAQACGVTDLVWMSGADARRFEPELACVAALHSPSTGIVDSHGYMLSLLGEAEDHGAVIAYETQVDGIAPAAGGVDIHIAGFDGPQLRCRVLVNSAGLDAAAVARTIAGFPAAHVPKAGLAKGHYFALSGKAPFSRLVYPVPEPGGLGIHLTLDLAGQARFGPDVEWIDAVDYSVPPGRAEQFYPAIRRYWPGLEDGRLQPAYAGIRPKISGPGEPAADFCISGPDDHGVQGVINLFGIESPGLTASLALARRVAGMAAAA